MFQEYLLGKQYTGEAGASRDVAGNSSKEATGVQMGLESLAEWCSWELRMDVSDVEKEKATRSNDYWGCNFMKCYLQIHDLKKLCGLEVIEHCGRHDGGKGCSP